MSAWKPIPASPTLARVQFQDVVWTGQRFAAAAVNMSDAVVFLDSANGIAWNLQAPTWRAGFRGMAVGAGGLVAVGDQSGAMVVWTSLDGLAWNQVADSPAMHAESGSAMRLGGVARAGNGWIAVGEEDPSPCQTGCVPVRGVVWRSSDGSSWLQQAPASALVGASLKDVALFDGKFVTAGRIDNTAAVWTSPDGIDWTRAPDKPAFHAPPGTDTTMGSVMSSLVVVPSQVIGVGEVMTQGGAGSALAWWSPDGQNWTAATGAEFLHGQAFRVTATASGYLAVGPSGPASCLGGIWSSTSGWVWSCEANATAFANFMPYGVASAPKVEVVVGFGRPTGETTGAGWYRTITP